MYIQRLISRIIKVFIFLLYDYNIIVAGHRDIYCTSHHSEHWTLNAERWQLQRLLAVLEDAGR